CSPRETCLRRLGPCLVTMATWPPSARSRYRYFGASTTSRRPPAESGRNAGPFASTIATRASGAVSAVAATPQRTSRTDAEDGQGRRLAAGDIEKITSDAKLTKTSLSIGSNCLLPPHTANCDETLHTFDT